MGVRRRRHLTADSILDGAMAVIEADGADALSMRRLAAHMGTTAMAFYNHFRDREELVDAIAARLYAGLPPPPPGSPWDARLTHLMDHFLRSAGRWPRTWQLAMGRPVKPASGQLIVATALAALADAGLDRPAAEAANFTLMMLLRGMFLWNGEHCGDQCSHPQMEAMIRQGTRMFLDGVAAYGSERKRAAARPSPGPKRTSRRKA